MALIAGTRLGPYEIQSSLGAGGMGEVCRARDTRLNRTVAIKVLPDALASDARFRERLDREARAISSLNHPHICRLYDVGDQNGTAFLVLEYLEGETLDARLSKGALSFDSAVRYGVQIADALETAHRAGVVHRDLKPGNIMLTKVGAVLLDFGLAKSMGPGGAVVGVSMLPTSPGRLTADGTILGTLQYMAPEQIEGEEADARTDIFALGLVLYEMLTGRKAFPGKSPASVMSAILKDDPPPLSAVQPLTPQAVDHVVRVCLAKDREERWQSARDVAQELKWAASTSPQIAGPSGTPSKRGAAVAALTGIAGLAIGIAAAFFIPSIRSTPDMRASVKAYVLPPAGAIVSSSSAPAISPDGRRLVFVGSEGASGRSRLWIRSLDSLTAQPIAGTEDAQQPFWSPDGVMIAFFSGGKLKKVAASGGPVQSLCDVSATTLGGSWGADGTILFGDNLLTPIESVPASGGKPATITVLDRSRQERGHEFPYFLPDGRHFLYLAVSANRENTGIYVGALGSSETKRVASVQSQARYAAPGFLLFVRDGTLLAQRFDPGRLEVTGEPVPIAEHVTADSIFGDAMLSISDNGTLAYRTGNENELRQLSWLDRSGKLLGQIGPPAEYLNPELSPDGKRVAVERRSAQGDRDIWLLEASGEAPKRFTFRPSDEYFPVWSPDGTRIVFGSNRDGTFGLYEKLANGAGDEKLLLKSAVDVGPFGWSPDGRFIVFRRLGEKAYNQVWVLPLFGDRKPFVGIQPEEFSQNGPRLSANGRWVAYWTNETGRYEVYLQSFPAPSGKWQVSNGGGMLARWGAGKELFYLSLDGSIMAVTIGGSDSSPVARDSRRLFEAHLLGGTRTVQGFRHQYDVTPDGQRFLVNMPAGESTATPITLVLNWASGLK